jgi:hypothetical protein
MMFLFSSASTFILDQKRFGFEAKLAAHSFRMMIHSREAQIENLDTSAHSRDLRAANLLSFTRYGIVFS